MVEPNNNKSIVGSIKGEVGTEYWQIYAKYLVRYF